MSTKYTVSLSIDKIRVVTILGGLMDCHQYNLGFVLFRYLLWLGASVMCFGYRSLVVHIIRPVAGSMGYDKVGTLYE